MRTVDLDQFWPAVRPQHSSPQPLGKGSAAVSTGDTPVYVETQPRPARVEADMVDRAVTQAINTGRLQTLRKNPPGASSSRSANTPNHRQPHDGIHAIYQPPTPANYIPRRSNPPAQHRQEQGSQGRAGVRWRLPFVAMLIAPLPLLATGYLLANYFEGVPKHPTQTVSAPLAKAPLAAANVPDANPHPTRNVSLSGQTVPVAAAIYNLEQASCMALVIDRNGGTTHREKCPDEAEPMRDAGRQRRGDLASMASNVDKAAWNRGTAVDAAEAKAAANIEFGTLQPGDVNLMINMPKP